MANYTPQQIEEILQEFFDVVGTRQYVGARYVPLFGRRGEESIDWDDSAPYEPLTIVNYQGNSYTSRTYVPAGIDIANQDYWALTGAYNAQVEAYRQEVVRLQEEWVDWKTDTEDGLDQWKTDTIGDLDDWKTDTVEDFEQAIDNIPNILPSSAFDPVNTVKKYVDDSVAYAVKDEVIVIGDSYSENNRWQQYIPDYTFHTFAVGGAGFKTTHYTNQTFGVQLQSAIQQVANNTIDLAKLKMVVVYGGVNDFRLGEYDEPVAAQANALIQTYRASVLRDVPLRFVLGNAGRLDDIDQVEGIAVDSYAKYPEWCYKLAGNMKFSQGCDVYARAYTWLGNYTDFTAAQGVFYSDDKLHPSVMGAKIISGYMTQIIEGGNPQTFACQSRFNATWGLATVKRYVTSVDDGCVCINLHLNWPSGFTTNQDLVFDLSQLSSQFNVPYIKGSTPIWGKAIFTTSDVSQSTPDVAVLAGTIERNAIVTNGTLYIEVKTGDSFYDCHVCITYQVF